MAPVKVIFRLAAKVRVLSLEPPLHTHRDAPPLHYAYSSFSDTDTQDAYPYMPRSTPSLTSLLSPWAADRVTFATTFDYFVGLRAE